MTTIVKVSGTSRTAKVAGAIAGLVRDSQQVFVQAIGASAVNQAVKAMILARNYLKEDQIEIVFFPEFMEVEIEKSIRTALRFAVVRH